MGYDERLDRALDEMTLVDREGDRFEIPDPDLRTEGHATVFENFRDVVDRLNREPDHVLQYLQGELGTSASIDETGRARLTGDFRERRVRETIDAYAEAYVRCPECGLPDTRIETERGTPVLRCEACGALSPTGG